MIKDFFNDNNIDYFEDTSLKKYNTYRIDINCQYLIFPRDELELINVLKEIKKENLKYLVLGNGSNVIFNTDYFNGAIIKLDKLNKIDYNDKTVVVGAGYPLIKLANETVNKGLSGLEFAAGIPGLVGASTAMNAGAYNSDLSNIIKEVKVLNDKLEIEILDKTKLNYSYRDSFLKQHKEYIVLSTTFELTEGDIQEMKNKIEERKIKRIASQPLNMPNAGSVFRNPEGMYAGELIEKSNLKGYNIGDAEVSTKHANFIVNTGNAKGKDIVELINKIKKDVKENYNVDLKLEQIIVE